MKISSETEKTYRLVLEFNFKEWDDMTQEINDILEEVHGMYLAEIYNKLMELSGEN